MEREPLDEGRQRRAPLSAGEQRGLWRCRSGVEGREDVVDLLTSLLVVGERIGRTGGLFESGPPEHLASNAGL
jgi:hypothetical protein